ncbi:hypothetical protein F4808DRAFT_453614 [Astrocystis sublimbata]|nr:hypothetical protein F4808DRAFT_453614 [Astrocystis sublimbata]
MSQTIEVNNILSASVPTRSFFLSAISYLPPDSGASTPTTVFNDQHDSSFFQKLPLEIRKIIYSYVWQGPYDHMYHEPNGRHLHFKNGHWVHTRCVMYQEDDEDPDLIQKQMDQIRNSGRGDLLLWQRRLASTWGQRHWRCAERVEYGRPTSIDRTDLGALMVVCKMMHPEVIESFIECHKLIFNDVFSAHRFLLHSGSTRPIRHIRNLDLTLSVPFYELRPFMGSSDPTNNDDNAAAPMASLTGAQKSRLGAIFAALAESPTCMHSLRVSLDVYDRGPWRKMPERALASHLERIPIRRGKRGEVNYTVEFPSALPIPMQWSGFGELDENVCEVGESRPVTPSSMPFKVTRRPRLRYWQFIPGEVEHFNWLTNRDAKELRHRCFLVLSKEATFISNPYELEWAGRSGRSRAG